MNIFNSNVKTWALFHQTGTDGRTLTTYIISVICWRQYPESSELIGLIPTDTRVSLRPICRNDEYHGKFEKYITPISYHEEIAKWIEWQKQSPYHHLVFI